MPLAEDRDGMISAFRGMVPQKNASEKMHNAGRLADEILKDLNLGETSPLETVHENWDRLVPERLSGLSEPADISATVLYVRVPNSAAKQELAFAERAILSKLTKLPGCMRIRKIRFI